ncbi:hypothetical protein [uncultured Metabacillus sp.]|uniref:hypothetical protein n=1 Tax=uncultured Metabacillus sp. TaxID=2860135 RepID=UPI002614B61C|nr:hypothetical protein [uncultured Metabacillus sp.]
MTYYDNQESVANIYVGLVERGWKCYGYKPDESDSYTDYWSPARWDGIAEKDGYILLIDVYGTHDSGRQITKSTYSPDWAKIEKLQATINDKAASENEKEMSQKAIDRMMEKEHKSKTIIEEYPTYKNANPKGCNWHIEKDGNIIAKGKGAFQCDGYLFGGYEKETMKKVNAFVDRIEKHIADNTQLVPVIKKVVKKVIKPVEVTDRKTLQVGDVLSFDYHGHYWKVYNLTDKTYSYQLLGSEKRGYQETKNGKRYYDFLNKFEKNLAEGKIKIYTLQEVEEVTEKIVYKKAKRENAQKDNLLQGETVEENTTSQEAAPEGTEATQNKDKVNNTITYKTGTGSKENGIEITFTSKPDEETRNKMKSVGFRWGGKQRSSIWWAVLNDERLELAKQLASENIHDEEQEEIQAEEEIIYNSEDTNEQEEIKVDPSIIETVDNMNVDLQFFASQVDVNKDDIFLAFEDIDLTKGNNSVISEEDQEHVNNLEKQFKEVLSVYNDTIDQLKQLNENNKYVENYHDFNPLEDRIKQLTKSFVHGIVGYFNKKYNISIDSYELVKKYDCNVTSDDLISEVIESLDGYNFQEKATQEIKENISNVISNKDIKLNNNKISINSFFYCDSFDIKYFNAYRIHYNYRENFTMLFKALSHYMTGETDILNELNELHNSIVNNRDQDIMTTHDINLHQLKNIKLFKNGRLDIQFTNKNDAKNFMTEYLQR